MLKEWLDIQLELAKHDLVGQTDHTNMLRVQGEAMTYNKVLLALERGVPDIALKE